MRYQIRGFLAVEIYCSLAPVTSSEAWFLKGTRVSCSRRSYGNGWHPCFNWCHIQPVTTNHLYTLLHFPNTEVFTSKFYMWNKLILKHTTFEMTVTNLIHVKLNFTKTVWLNFNIWKSWNFNKRFHVLY